MAIEPGRSVDDLFNDALTLPATERHDFVLAESGGDEAICAEVQSLLDAHGRAEDFLPDQAIGTPADLEDAAQVDRVGERVGPYRVEELIAVGGWGRCTALSAPTINSDKRSRSS
jgi:hypothetical protein